MGGGNFEVDSYLSREMSPWRCYLDVVVLTHPHQDHLEGLNRVLSRCTVALVLANSVDYSSNLYEDWKDKISDMNVRSIVAGDTFFVDSVAFRALWPPEEYLSRRVANTNNVSVILFLKYKDFSALFTGDAEREALSALDFDEELDLYKAGHHGAKNALDRGLIDRLRPRYFGISVGADNNYGHPDSDVIQYLERIGRVYRTDLDGSIEIVYNQR